MVLNSKDAKTQLWTIKMGGIKYGFRASKESYKGIDKQLGVDKAKDTDNDIVIGSDNKPPRVRISLANGKSIIRFADPGKLESLIIDGSLNGKKYNGVNINAVRCLQG